jgi:hypothetical protein
MRIKSKWHKKDKTKTPEELAGAVGFFGWRIAAHHVEAIEEAGFEMDSAEQRFAVLRELLIFLIQVADRLAHRRLSDADRRLYVIALARHMAGTLQDNALDHFGPGDYGRELIDQLNAEIPDYAEFSWGEDGPGYQFKRYLGEKVLAIVGEEAAKRWVIDQVMDIEAPEAVKTFAKNIDNVFAGVPETEQASS